MESLFVVGGSSWTTISFSVRKSCADFLDLLFEAWWFSVITGEGGARCTRDERGTADGVVVTEVLGCKAVEAELDVDDELGSPM